MDDEEKLIESAKNGDGESFEILYKRYIKIVYGYVYNKVNRKEDAEDLTSEIWIATLKSLSHYEGNSSFKNWLFGIVKHKIMDFYQEKYKIEKTPLVEEIFLEEEKNNEDQGSEKEKRIAVLLQKLPENYRQVLMLRFLKGYTTAEIAQQLGLTISNVKVIQYRAIKKAKTSNI